jgi:hypothetical protein
MKLFCCKSIGAGMMLLAAAGCAGEGPSQSAPGNAPLAAPANPPSTPGGGGNSDLSGQMPPAGASGAPAAKGGQTGGGGPKMEGPSVDTDKAAGGTGGPSFSAEQLAAIKKLPVADQQLALTQVSCPVSGDPLGSMGMPWKTSAEGRSFFLCCKGCEKDVKADPKAVLAKLDQQRPK